MILKTLTIFLSAFILLLVIELIREERLTFKYAVGWMTACVLAIVLTVFDYVLFSTAKFFGFELASNFIFFVLLAVFVFLSLLMTILLCQQGSHNASMAQRIGMLAFEIEALKKQVKMRRLFNAEED